MKIGNSILAKDIFGNVVMLPAMEADPAIPDITRTTSNMMKKASSRSGAAVSSEGSPATPTEEVPSEDTGTPPTEDGAPTDPLDETMPEDDGSMQDGLPPDDGSGEFGDNMGDAGDMGMGGEAQLTKEQANSLSRLHGNLTMLYQSISTLSESMSMYSAPSTTAELRKIYNAATDHLSNTKEYLSDILSTPFTLESYPEKLRKFVALKNVYNIVCDMLKIHFNALELENGPTP